MRNFRLIPKHFGGVILLIESKLTLPDGSCAQDAAGIGAADECRHLLVCFAMCPRLAKHTAAGANRGCRSCSQWQSTWHLHMALAHGTCTWHLLVCFTTGCRSLHCLLQPLLLDFTTSSCCCTFSSNFWAAMAEQLCSNPWRNSFVEGKIWDHPSKITQE